MDIILIQMDVKFGDPDHNFSKVKEQIESIQPSPKSLIVVPELFLTGYHAESINQTGEPLGTGKYSNKIMDLVRDFDILFYGSIAERKDDKMYNTAIFVSKHGIEASYRKSHLFGPMGEKLLFDAGRELVTHTYEEYIFGLSICYDLRFAELYQRYLSKGVEVNLICAEWPITRVDHWRSLAKARAIENQTFVVAVNRVGQDPDYSYGGHSAIFSPFGKMIAGLDHAEEGIIQANIDLELVNEFRGKFDIRDDKWI